ncbi:MAG: hypothetical protein L0Y55_08695, partial [Anaerolineales bacterium]|nr:hypothetical protein [Anaerolineales bacterium]
MKPFVLRPVFFILLLVVISAVLVTALILPAAASAWFRNLANARIARAIAPATDPSARIIALNDADAQLAQADAWSRDDLTAFARARAFLARDDAPRAVETFRATGDALRDDFIAQFLWAHAEYQSGDAPAAFERWRIAGAFEYFINQTQRAGFKHQWQEAEAYARIAVGIAPDRADTHYYLGDAVGYQSPHDPEAMREIERAAELAKDNPELLATILSRQGELLVAQGRDRDALAVFARAQQAAPRDSRPHIGYAQTLLRLDPNAKQRAVEILTQVVADAPWTIGAHLALAQIAEA